MIKIEHRDGVYWFDENNIQAIELRENPQKNWSVNVHLFSFRMNFDFESKEKAQYFLDRYFKDVIE